MREAVMNNRVSVNAHPRYLIATDAASFAIGAVLLLLVSRIRLFLSPLAVLLLIICLAMGFGFDILIWFLNGIRSIELDGESLTLYRGLSLEMQRFNRETITAVSVRSRLGRRSVVLLLGEKHKLRIAEDAFPSEEFARFLSALAGWR
jgi:hypothetical protein